MSEKAPEIVNLSPEEVAKGISEGRILMIDIREPNETAAEAYPDATLMPLSTFDPQALPDPQGKDIVFACRSGNRTGKLLTALQEQGSPLKKHLGGGLLAWKAAGLPTKVPGA